METQHGGRKHLDQSVPRVRRPRRERRVNEVPLVNPDHRGSEVLLVNRESVVNRDSVVNRVRQVHKVREALPGHQATRDQTKLPKRERLIFELTGANHLSPVNQTRC